MKEFPKRFTVGDCLKDQFVINIAVLLPDHAFGLTTGWGDYNKSMVEIRRVDVGSIELHHIQTLLNVIGQVNLLDIVR